MGTAAYETAGFSACRQSWGGQLRALLCSAQSVDLPSTADDQSNVETELASTFAEAKWFRTPTQGSGSFMCIEIKLWAPQI
jgi:hypothetical protein